MNFTLKSARYAAWLVLMLVGSVVTARANATLALQGSSEIPAAVGTARLQNTKNGNVQIRVHVRHLATPARIVPGANVFVLWVRGLAPGAEAQNLGALRVDKNLSGKITAVTAMSSFDLFLTCEQSQTVTLPAAPELLPVHYMSK